MFDDVMLKRSIIAACGNQLTSFYHHAFKMKITRLLEALELCEIQNRPT